MDATLEWYLRSDEQAVDSVRNGLGIDADPEHSEEEEDAGPTIRR